MSTLMFTHGKKGMSELELACNPVDVNAEKFNPGRLAGPQVHLVVHDGERSLSHVLSHAPDHLLGNRNTRPNENFN